MTASHDDNPGFDFVQAFLSRSENDQRRLLAEIRKGLAAGGAMAELPAIMLRDLEANEEVRARIAELGDASPQKLPKSKARRRY